jgi:hypothetical protein
MKVPMDQEDKDYKTYLVKIKKYDTGTPEEFLRWRLTLNDHIKNHDYSGNYEMIMNLTQAMLAGRGLESFLVKCGPKKSKTRRARPKRKSSILQIRFMIVQYLNWQSALLASKNDGEMPLRGSASTRKEIFSWGNSTQKKLVKDCKI